MASTFTGLKLQGDIGRVGNVDLSDISGYAELPDGKVISGTETGTLLIWDGGLIRAVLVRPDGEGGAFKPCHEGMIEVVRFDNATKTISTTGADGHMRWWDYATVRDAEPEDDRIEVLIEPVKEAAIGDGAGGLCSVKSIITTEPDHWLVQDANGGIVRVGIGEGGELGESRQLTSFHGGCINGMDISAVSDHAVTAGSDGTVRLWAYAERREVYRSKFCAGATFVQMAPAYVDGSQRTVIAGFDDGVVRILLRCSDGFKIVDCFKPHNKRVTVAKFSPDGSVLATGSADGTVFFLAAKYPKSPPKAPKLPGVTLAPIGFAKAPGGVSALQWHENMKEPKLLVGCETGHAFEMKAPNWKPGQPDSVDSTITFEFEATATHYTFNRPRPTAMSIVESKYPPVGDERDAADAAEKAAIIEQKRVMALEAEQLQKELDEAERIAVYPVKHIGYVPFSGGNFELALGGEAAGKIWECQFGAKDPMRGTKTRQSALTVTRASVSGKLSVQAFEDGTVRVAPSRGKSYWVGAVHDGIYGSVTGAAVTRDDSFLLSTSSDGSFFVQKIGAGLLAERVPATDAEEVTSVAEDPTPAVEDITDPTKYSFEEEKIKLAEDIARAAAEEAKLGVRGYINKLRDEFQALLAENEARPPHERLPREAFEVDPGIREVVEAETQGKMEMVKAEYAWLKERADLQLKRLKEFFLDPVESERVVLRSFGSGRRSFAVTSFRVAKFSDDLRADIERCHTTELQRKTAGTGARAGLTPGKSFRKNAADEEEEEEGGGGAWTVLARVDASRPVSSSDAGDGETERGRGRTLKLALVRGESEETRETATVVERERWTNVRDEDELAPGCEVFVARAVFERRRAGAVAMANDGEVAPAPADERASRARAREKRARAATLAAARGDAESEISAKAPKFIEFDALKPIEIRVKAPKAEVSAAARRLAETSLAAPKPPATASKASTPGASASSSTETTDAAAVVRKKPSLPPRRATRAPPPGFGDA